MLTLTLNECHANVWAHTPPPLASQGQADLLKHAKNEVLENLKQIHLTALTCNLYKGAPGPMASAAERNKPRRSLEAIPEKAQAEEDLQTDED